MVVRMVMGVVREKTKSQLVKDEVKLLDKVMEQELHQLMLMTCQLMRM